MDSCKKGGIPKRIPSNLRDGVNKDGGDSTLLQHTPSIIDAKEEVESRLMPVEC